MTDEIFNGLEYLGFKDTSNLNLYEIEEDTAKDKSNLGKTEKDKILSLLYTKTITCPVCNKTFKSLAVKSSAYKLNSRDSDLFMRYFLINPYFYDVWICEDCGYAAMKADFLNVKSYEIDSVAENITPRWKKKNYPEIYDVNIAIERYKLSLLNYVVMKSKSSKKAVNCLKIAWMYRLIDSESAKEKELLFMKESLTGFEYAYYNESFPIYGMDSFTIMYLIGELNRRVGNYDNALLWFSKVITTPGVKSKLKEMARTQKDLARLGLENSKNSHSDIHNDMDIEDENFTIEKEIENNSDVKKTEKKETKKGFFSKLFGKNN